MRSPKRYSTQTISKRVDHEAGRHRTRQAPPEPAICEICGDIYADRRWSKPADARGTRKHLHFRPANKVVCPACKRVREGVPSGFLHLEGEFLAAHRDEIERLVRNEAERASEDNPLARIMKWEPGEKERRGSLTVTTTTEHLAQRLGRAVEKAYNGKVRYDFSHENKLAHVWWRRD
jgi:hypothetical protein